MTPVSTVKHVYEYVCKCEYVKVAFVSYDNKQNQHHIPLHYLTYTRKV